MKDTKWADFYGDFDNHQCPMKCKYSYNRNWYNESQLVIFNARRIYQDRHTESLPLDMKRNGDMWLLHGTEPPWNTYLNFANYDNMFNWTSFPRPDSDIRTYYNNYEEITGNDVVFARRKMTDAVEHFRKRPKMIGWVVSNCHSGNQREVYAGQMMKYIHLDIHGLCANKSVRLGGDRDIGYHENIINQYKFYLSFENANCRGYITEKVWNPLRQGAIPVVMGNCEAYRRYAPPGSYIDTAWFDSPEELVKYLHKVAQNETLYKTYFEWIAKYKIVNNYWCDVCTAVHNWDGVHQVYSDLYGWYSKDTCDLWTVSSH
jgi:hypothetical protein